MRCGRTSPGCCSTGSSPSSCATSRWRSSPPISRCARGTAMRARASAVLGGRAWTRDAVPRLFDELDSRVLRERLFATLQSAEPEAEGGIEVQGGTIPAGGLRACRDAYARDGRRVGLSFHGVVGTAAAADLAGI